MASPHSVTDFREEHATALLRASFVLGANGVL